MESMRLEEIAPEFREATLKTCLSSREPLRLTAFPKKQKKKIVLMDEVVKQFEPGRTYSEPEVSGMLKEIYGDFTTLRRALVDYGYLGRTDTGSEYWVR